MAFISTHHCPKCERETDHLNSTCRICADRIRRAEIAAWNSLTTDEKLQDLRRRIEGLESMPVRY